MRSKYSAFFPTNRSAACATVSLIAFAGAIAAQAQGPPTATKPTPVQTAQPPATEIQSPAQAAQLPTVATQAQNASAAASPAQQEAAGMAAPTSLAVSAQSAAAANLPKLTLDQAIRQVLNVNPTIVQARLAQQRAHVLVAEATGQLLPQVSAEAYDTYSSTATSEAQAGQTPTVSSTTALPVIQDSAFGDVGTAVTSSSGAGTISTGDAESTTTASGTTIVPVGGIPTSGSGTDASGSSGVISGSSGAGSSSTSGATSGGGTSTTTTGTSQIIRPGRRPDPKQTGGSGTGTGTGTGTTGSDFVSVATRHNNYAADASATQILDVFGIARANVDAAKKNATFSDLDVNRLENDTALNAKDTYFAVLKAVSDVATATELLNNADAVLKNAQINYNAGASPQFDVISAQAQVSSSQASLISAQNELQVEKAILDNLMSLPTTYDFAPVDVPITTLPPTTDPAPLISTADASRPEVLEANVTQGIARDLSTIARQDSLPSFGLSGGIDYQPNLTAGQSHYTEFVTGAVSVPLYTGGAARAEVNAARINETNQQSVGVQIRQDVELEVKSALINIITYQNLVTADTSAVSEYREALRIANVQYQAGVGTLLNVTNAQANLANAESNLNSSVFQQQSAYAALIRAQGSR